MAAMSTCILLQTLSWIAFRSMGLQGIEACLVREDSVVLLVPVGVCSGHSGGFWFGSFWDGGILCCRMSTLLL